MLSKITDRIWICGADDLRRKNIVDNGITAILNVSRSLNVDVGLLWNGKGFEYQKVGITDDGENTRLMIQAAATVLTDMTNRHENVVCHCHQGQSRSATVIAVHLTQTAGMTLREAVAFVQAKHHVKHSLWGPRPELVETLGEGSDWVRVKSFKK